MSEASRREELEAIWTQVELRVLVEGQEIDPRILSDAEGTIHLITAWNPRSEQISAELNSLRQVELESELDEEGWRWWPASGSSPDGSWREEGAAVAGLSRDAARAIGSRWGQDAIYELSPGSTIVVWCEDGRVLELPR